MPGLRS